ncbi:hypothetical protein V8C37DRAFT_414693 [Trichoderma ceciliae]
MASFQVPPSPPNPHIIQICAAVINQYNIESHHLRTCINKQSQDLDRQRLEIQNMQDIISQLQNDNRRLQDAVSEHDKEMQEAGATIRVQHHIVTTQKQLIASLGNDLAQARAEDHRPTAYCNQPTSEQTYAAAAMDFAKLGFYKSRDSKFGRPPSPTLIDVQVKSAGGLSTACDLTAEEIQAKKVPIPLGDRVIELSRENGRLRQEIEYYRSLTEAFQPLMPIIEYHVNGIHKALRAANTRIGAINAEWEEQQSQSQYSQ